ncbi:MAG: efflux RND transporter periplasmic adaptor subunit [Terracidiphilus sp.]
MNQEAFAGPDPSRPRPPMDTPVPERRRRHLWIWAVVLVLFGLLFYWVITQQNKSAAATVGGGRHAITGPVAVTTATAQTGSINVYMNSIGTVTPVYMASITPQVTGVVMKVHYHEGQYLRQGDPLVDIDSRPYAAQLVEAQGLLERDQNLLAEAEMDLKRYKEAWSRNAIPRQTLEDQEKVVLQDQGTVKNDTGTVQYDEVQLSYCHIASPITGRVGLRLVDPGNLVTANSSTALVVVTQVQPITVIFPLNEDDLPQVLERRKGGKQLNVDVFDRNQQKLLSSGRLATIDNQIDTNTGTVKLRAEFDNKNGILFPNQFVNARLLVNTLQNQILIPSSAIQHNGNQDFVYLISNGKAVSRNVKSGYSDAGNTAVQGLQPGDVVANSSFEKLQTGSPISISKIKLPSTSESTEGNAP